LSLVYKFLAGGLMLASAGCATQNSIRDGTATAVQTVVDLPEPDPRMTVGELVDSYYLGPRDKVDIYVYQLSDMNRTVEVDSAGEIQLPFVGTIKVAGKTAAEVRDEISGRLAQDVLQSPQVAVQVSGALNQRLTVTGAVNSPGMFGISGRVTLLQAIALARGTSTIANGRIVVVFRTIDNQQMDAWYDLQKIKNGELSDPNLVANDIVVVETSRGKVLLRDVVSTLPLLGVFRTVDTVTR